MIKALSISIISFIAIVSSFFIFQNLGGIYVEVQATQILDFCDEPDKDINHSEVHFDNCITPNSIANENDIIGFPRR